jgi:hypothetical protein
MRPNETEFAWSTKSERAAALVAHDELPDHAIARTCKVSKATLERWKALPAFATRVDEHRALWREKIQAEGIANRQNRIDAQNDRHRRLQQIVEERAAATEHAAVPGWKTGLLVHTRKQIGGGEYAQLVDEYQVDTGLLKEFREHEKLTAAELGQTTERKTVTLEIKREAERIAAKFGIPLEQVLRESGIATGDA